MFEIGSTLREARARRGLDFPELEEITKIRSKYLRALEDEQFTVLPAPTYVKGFLRTYAEALGLEGQPFVDEYASRFVVGEEEPPVRVRNVPSYRRRREQRESRLAVLALLGIALVTALVFAAWKFGGPESEKVPGLPAKGQAVAPSSPAPLTKVTLDVRALRGSSWMEVRDGSVGAKLLYSGTLERSQRQTFQGKRLYLALAKPQNVVVRLQGLRVQLPPGSAFVVTTRRIAPAAG
jgi:Helix-turn-helix domain